MYQSVRHDDMARQLKLLEGRTLQRMMWDKIMDLLWQDRNDIKHRKDNAYDVVDDERLAARIVWYVEHKHELMGHHDQVLAEIDLTRLSRMRRETK